MEYIVSNDSMEGEGEYCEGEEVRRVEKEKEKEK